MERLLGCAVVSEYVYDSLDATEELLKEQKRNCWQTAYRTEDRSVVEALLDARDDVEYIWRDNGGLTSRS